MKIILLLVIVFLFFIGYKLFLKEENKEIKNKEKTEEKTPSTNDEIRKFQNTKELIYVLEEEYDEKKRHLDIDYRRAQDLTEESLKNKVESLKNDYKIQEYKLEKNFDSLCSEEIQSYDFFKDLLEDSKQIRLEELRSLQKEVNDFRLACDSINASILRERKIKEDADFFKIIISEQDKEDWIIINSIEKKLNNKKILNKLIFDVFVKRPLDELIKRVTSGKTICGIYKITYEETGESYIGKTTNIATRWKNHIKTACGVEGGATKTTFHNRLSEDGIWNYTFEILEEVPKEKLGEREKFYINLYGTKDYGLNTKAGG